MSERLVEALRQEFGDEILAHDGHLGDHHVRVPRERLLDVLGHLRGREGCAMLGDVIGVDHPEREERFDVVYYVRSVDRGLFQLNSSSFPGS